MLAAARTGDLFSGVRSFFESGVWLAIERGALFLLAVFWAASIFSVYRDASRRLASPLAIGAAVALATALPFVGALVYRQLRPADFLDDRRLRDLECRALAATLAQTTPCPACAAPLARGYLACPRCATRVRERCGGCAAPVEHGWRACPYCAASLEPAPAAEPERALAAG